MEVLFVLSAILGAITTVVFGIRTAIFIQELYNPVEVSINFLSAAVGLVLVIMSLYYLFGI